MIEALATIAGSPSEAHSWYGGAVGILVVASLGLVSIAQAFWRARLRNRQKSLYAKVREAQRLTGQGRFTEAEQLCHAVLGQCRPERPGDRTSMLLAAGQGAVLRALCGRPDDAFERVLADYGPERYPESHAAWLALATYAEILVRRGRYADGVALAARVVEECERRWGATSSLTVLNRMSLGFCLQEGKRPADAVVVLTALLTTDAVAHSTGLRTRARHEIAEANLLLGHVDQAEPELCAVLADYEAHEDYRLAALGVRFAIAKIAAVRGRDGEAAEAFTEVLGELRAIVGDDGPWTLATRFELANLTAHSGNRSEALAEHQAVLAAEPVCSVQTIRTPKQAGPASPNTRRDRRHPRKRSPAVGLADQCSRPLSTTDG